MTELDGTKGYVLTNDKEIEEKSVDRDLTFILTEDDFSAKGKLAGRLSADLNKSRNEFESVKKDWKGKIEEKEGELSSVLATIRRGEEVRRVKCIERKDYNSNIVHYIFNGEVMHERPLEINERQMRLVKAGEAKKPGAPEFRTPEKAGVGSNGATPVPTKENTNVAT